MFRRFRCLLFRHRWQEDEVWLPDLLAGLVWCRRCGRPGWIERH